MRLRVVAVGVAILVLALVVGVVVVDPRLAAQSNQTVGGPAAPTPTYEPAPSPTPPDMAPEMARLAAHLPPGSVSVAVRNLETGAEFAYGSDSGHTSASIFKVNILEALMLQLQASGAPLSAAQSRDASVMIVSSDNDSATRLYRDAGGAKV